MAEAKEVPPKEAVVAEGRVKEEDPPKEEDPTLEAMEAKGRGEALPTEEDLLMKVDKGTTMGCLGTMMV